MVKTAIRLGYRHIDTAAGYRTEEAVGKAVRESGIPRSDFFVTTKLWNTDHGRVAEAFEESLARLGLEYIDLYLMHWPQAMSPSGNIPQPSESPTFVETWKAMEKLLQTGKVKSIGVSNFSIKTLEVLLDDAIIVPAVNQNDLMAYCKSRGIHLTASSPLGYANSPLHSDGDILRVAWKYAITPAQVMLSWGMQRGTSVIPKSEKEERLQANISVSLHSAEGECRLSGIFSIHRSQDYQKQI
ncbi:hypothetical protein FRB90_000893 [Tulasnella sp. 427]|nr:hypothetical protein FRB90_000893 [Tulasnella sp. 427]